MIVMKNKFAYFAVVAAMLMLFGVYPAVSEMNVSAQPGAVYGAYIDRCISQCEVKASLIDSRSEKIRQAAAMHCLMAGFLKANKTELIKDMIAQDIGTQEYKMDYYLQARFFEIFKDAAKTVRL
jgi:hypothetical protein